METAKQSLLPQWQRAFPDMTDMPAIPEGWKDTSYHNDACPSFEREIDGRTYRLWVDYPKYEQSECGFLSIGDTGEYRRFHIERLVPDSADNDAHAWFTHFDAFDVCLAAVRAGGR